MNGLFFVSFFSFHFFSFNCSTNVVCTEADGANLLSNALLPHHGTLIWRAFVYGNLETKIGKEELVMQAYDTFVPLDGMFNTNVIVQIKNGPMDFQIREPLHPLLGGLKHTNVMMEVQCAQEYTGQQIHAVNLITMWKEYLGFANFLILHCIFHKTFEWHAL